MHWSLFDDLDDDINSYINDIFDEQKKNIKYTTTTQVERAKQEAKKSIEDAKRAIELFEENMKPGKPTKLKNIRVNNGVVEINPSDMDDEDDYDIPEYPSKEELEELKPDSQKLLYINLGLLLLSSCGGIIVRNIFGSNISNIFKFIVLLFMLINLGIYERKSNKYWKLRNAKFKEEMSEIKRRIKDPEYRKRKQREETQQKQENKKKPFSTKKEYRGVKAIKKELIDLRSQLEIQFNNEPGEIEIADQVINQCLKLLDRIKSLQSAFKIILERSEEYSLDEVIGTLHQAEDNIGRNIFNISNRLILELNIEGFDRRQIDEYLQNNEDIVNGSTELVKEALEYIEGKENLDDNIIGIETLTGTIQSLKKQLR